MRLACALTLAGLLLAGDVVAQEKVDLNTATMEQLDALPGIGPTKAQAILDSRQKDGPFKSVQELERVKGIGASTVSKLAGRVTVSTKPAPSAVPSDTPAPTRRSTRAAVVRLDTALDRESPDGKINLNLGSAQELQQLDGISSAHARLIIAWRERKGPYQSIGDLAEVPGLPPSMLETLQYFVTTRVAVAELSPATLQALGLSPKAVDAVLKAAANNRLRKRTDLDRIGALTARERTLLSKLLWF